jgi:transcription elongation factor Elf1
MNKKRLKLKRFFDCPSCHVQQRLVTAVSGDGLPKVGAVGICSTCANWWELIEDDIYIVHVPTAEETAFVMAYFESQL